MKILSNGNIEITVQLMPAAYAALTETATRDKGNFADVVNVALISHNAISAAASEAGHPLSGEGSDQGARANTRSSTGGAP